METKKQTQIVVNVTADAKTKIKSLKEKFNASDKELVDAILVVLETVADETVQSALDKIAAEKQIAKVAAKIARLEAKIAEEQATLMQDPA